MMNDNETSSSGSHGSIHWLDEEQREILKQEVGGNIASPMYLLPERSIIEHKINSIILNYKINSADEEILDELIFEYNSKVDIAMKSVKRWQSERGSTSWDINALLYMEQPEIWSAIECLEDLADACKNLFDFVAKLEPRKNPIVPDYIKDVLETYRNP